MKIAICADSHDNLINISDFLYFCNYNEVDVILHCGDWCAPSTLQFFRENFKGKIYGVYGNVHDDDKMVKKIAKETKIKIKKDKLSFTLDKLKMYITHYPETAQRAAKTNRYHFVFYGHTHKPWKEIVNQTHVINPGTLAGMFFRATFALYDTKTGKLELKILDQIKKPAAQASASN